MIYHVARRLQMHVLRVRSIRHYRSCRREMQATGARIGACRLCLSQSLCIRSSFQAFTYRERMRKETNVRVM